VLGILETHHEFVDFSLQFPESSLVHCTSLQSEIQANEDRVSFAIYSHYRYRVRTTQHTVCSLAERRDSSNAELLANGDTEVAIYRAGYLEGYGWLWMGRYEAVTPDSNN